MSRKAGVSEEKLRLLANYQTAGVFNEREIAALRLTDALTRTPADVPDALYAELAKHFSEEELVELTSSIAFENYRARFNRTFDVPSQDFSEGAYCPLPPR